MSPTVVLLAQDPGPWTGQDTRLVVAALAGIAVIVGLITWLKVHPFLALTLGAGALGVIANMPVAQVVETFSTGLGSTIGGVGALIALGAMLGRILADSGGADRIVDTILGRSNERALPWAIALVAVIIGLPMFFDVGLVLLIPVILLVAKRSGQPLMLIGVSALAGLSVLHGLVPPHPGPLIAIDALEVDLGLTLGFGLLIAVPTVAVAGPLFARYAARWVQVDPPAHLVPRSASDRGASGDGGAESAQTMRRPGFAATLITVLLPVVLMLGKAIGEIWLDDASTLRSGLDLLGTPLVALLVATVVAMFTLGAGAGLGRDRISEVFGASLPPIAGILLITGAGGGFKETLVESGVADIITRYGENASLSPLILGWLVAVGIRLATGSATVATISAAGIVAPLAAGLDPAQGALLALAIGAGSLFFSHVNDTGFWLVKEYFGMTVGQTIKTWSVMETIISVFALICILLLDLVV
ncbi:GntT/GntP/DsdX family permease [Actinoalloteichus hymeniacidonis]|uniref:Gluconate transporter n=1 Tax=Actinoalloteichus hymeniacidonis TaxID=340345 RepID=A0AAC9HNT2_9PSEU|nr:gluconate:H+ symporter [Actinoalloteichus hymeniacidonis]AOS62558.1 gluconate transporter [Actinoalloteichus hymeniacidonis]MBB5909411.1 GntP family gluconate:H+ symporter [Actinoalloteichus hymeniacidonis]